MSVISPLQPVMNKITLLAGSRSSGGSPVISTPRSLVSTPKSVSDNIVKSTYSLKDEEVTSPTFVTSPTLPKLLSLKQKPSDNFNSTRAILKQPNGNELSASQSSFLEANVIDNGKNLQFRTAESGQHNALRQRNNYEILVLMSCIKFPDKMRELVTFVVSINDKEKDKEMWRIEKTYQDFCHLDEEVII